MSTQTDAIRKNSAGAGATRGLIFVAGPAELDFTEVRGERDIKPSADTNDYS